MGVLKHVHGFIKDASYNLEIDGRRRMLALQCDWAAARILDEGQFDHDDLASCHGGEVVRLV